MGDPFSLALVQSAPDANRLINSKRIVETGAPDYAGCTDRLRRELPFQTLMTVLRSLGWEEDLRVGTSTGRVQLP
jgi:hypothetical protein